MNLRLIFLLLLTALFTSSRGQNTIALPEIVNYTKQGYSAATQNWDIKQDRNGVLYFANNEGLLSFDGIYWKIYPLPNRTNVRSLEIGPDNRIYIGGQSEIGYFSPDAQGRLAYHSLKHLVPEKDRSFADVWNVINFQNQLFFRASNRIIHLNGTRVAVYPSSDWRFMGQSGGRLYAQEHEKGLLTFDNGTWKPFITRSALPEGSLITSVTPFGKDTTLITTFKHGVYFLTGTTVSRFQSRDLDGIAPMHIYESASIGSGHTVLATSLNGCYIIDNKGQLVQGFSRLEGLQNNNIRSVFLDRDRNIWLGLDNGIDYVAYNNAIKHVYPDVQNDGSGYASMIFRDRLYLGTSDGLYHVPIQKSGDLSFAKGRFESVTNTKGQVWNLSQVNEQLLAGHHEGAFSIQGGTATQLDKSAGYWMFLPLENVLPSKKMVTGTYYGVSIFNTAKEKFEKATSINFESSRFVTVDNGVIWVAHPYKGIYKIDLSAGDTVAKLYGNLHGLLSANDNYVYKVKNRIVFTTEHGIYEYNNAKDRFEPSAYFGHFFEKIPVRYLKEDPSGNLWFITGKKLGVVDFSGPKPKLIYLPELNNKMVSGFEHIYPYDQENIFLGAEKGFYHINFNRYKHNQYRVQVQLRQVRAIGRSDSLLFGGYYGEVNEAGVQSRHAIPEISHNWNSFHFEYSSTLFGQQSNVEYSYRLQGFNKAWSEWSRKTEKDYTNLPAGTYTFQVKARNTVGNESEINNFTFVVLPPWYQTYWAYTFYAFLLFGFAWFLFKRQQARFHRQQIKHEEEQKRLLYLHQLELEKSEKQIVKLRNEKLESEIHHKNTELASSAMHLVQKGELLSRIKEELMRLKKYAENEKTAEDFKKIIRILNEEDKMDADWEQFAHHFDKVHSDFLVALKKQHPNLSPNELKLCAYLRMNLSTKEIAQLMNISVRGVEISRYRLRKKLQVATGVNLFDFLMKIGTTAPTMEEVNMSIASD
jgi:ligand-binding sensor domain-containing protein/DNA-binding CsgD family transcriptional regulator